MVKTIPKDISSKVNLKARLKFELDFFEAVVQSFSYYGTGTPPMICNLIMLLHKVISVEDLVESRSFPLVLYEDH